MLILLRLSKEDVAVYELQRKHALKMDVVDNGGFEKSIGVCIVLHFQREFGNFHIELSMNRAIVTNPECQSFQEGLEQKLNLRLLLVQ